MEFEEITAASRSDYQASKRRRQGGGGEEDSDGEESMVPQGEGLSSSLLDESILRKIDEQPEIVFGLPELRKMALALERKVLKNQELRVKFAKEPTKFIDSETDLFEEIESLHLIATAPHLYPELVKLHTVPTLLGLMTHENTDIVAAVVGLIYDMTDVEGIGESVENALILVDALFEESMLSFMLQALGGLNEEDKEGGEAVHKIMGILENVIELKPSYAETIVASSEFLPWFLQRVQAPEFDNNKLYAAEMLAILLQDSDQNRRLLALNGGLEQLLSALSRYRKIDPETSDELEFLENLFDSVISVLRNDDLRRSFLDLEGVQLMLIMLKEKVAARFGALKVLNHVMSGATGAEACSLFVRELGLKSLFPLFMKPPKSKKKTGHLESDYEEHTCGVISSLLRNTPEGEARQRLLAKFSEDNHAKLDRLLELHVTYRGRLDVTEDSIRDEIEELEEEGDEIDEELENSFYLRRLEGGLYVLQLVDYILAEVFHDGTPQDQSKVLQVLRMKGIAPQPIITVLREHEAMAGDASGNEEALEAFKARLRQVTSFLASAILPSETETQQTSSTS